MLDKRCDLTVTPKDIATRYNVTEKWVRQVAREEMQGHPRHGRWIWSHWEDPDLRPVLTRLASGREAQDVREWETVLSAKNQVTIPVGAVRALDLKPGEKVTILLTDDRLELLPSPASWADHYAGAARGLYGASDLDIETYLRESRGEWEDSGATHPTPRNRWGDKSILIERRLTEEAEQVRDKEGQAHRLVPSFSEIARDFGVTRELVRQIADDLGIQSFHSAPKRLKRRAVIG